MSAPKTKNSPFNISKRLKQLFWIFLIGFAAQAVINYVQNYYSDRLDAEIDNAQIQGILGDEIIQRISEIERNYYKLVNQINPNTRYLTLKEVDKDIDEVIKLINVLEKGGTFEQELSLNLPDIDNVINNWSFTPIANQPYNILRIDAIPKLNAIRKQFDTTNLLLDEIHHLMGQDSPKLTDQMQTVLQSIKRTDPLFVRIQENINRIHYQHQNHLRQLKADIKQQKSIFIAFQYISIALLLMLGWIMFKFITRHIGALAHDLQEEKDKALAATESKSFFLANMSHEIRTPLNAITGFISLLKQQEKEPTKLKYLTTIDHSSQSLIGIINDILDYSKIESNKLEFDLIDFDPHEAFNSVADLFKAKCSEKNILMHVSIDPEMPHSIHADPLRIKQVVSNLLSNAVKFTPTGKQINLVINFDNVQNELTISVEDQGIGISPEHQARIFEAFSQAETHTTRKYGGTGLGLAISSLLIGLMGGRISLESESQKGSRFFFKIPVNEGKPIQKVSDKFEHHGELSGTVLLVEDNATNQLLMGAILKKMGLEFNIAKDGIEAVTAYQQKTYDLILMDENMPNMSGSEATQKIREIEAETLKHTPIIALTANAMKGDRERFIGAGMNDHLSKPIQIPELNRVIGQYLATNNPSSNHPV